MKKKIQILVILLFIFIFSACGGSTTNGTITAVSASAPLSGDGINTGQLVIGQELVVLLEDGTEVTAACPENLISKVSIPSSEFTYTINSIPFDAASGNFSANIFIQLNFNQTASLKEDESGEWLVVNIGSDK